MRAAVVSLLIVAACSSKREAPADPPADPSVGGNTNAPPAVAVARGSVTGTVAFEGPRPAPHRIDRSSDPACEPREIVDESILVNDDGTLRNVLIRVVDEGLTSPVPSEPVVVSQKDCIYLPRVQAAVEGQEIEFHNDDGTIHNIHGYDVGTRPPAALYNEAQPSGAAPIRKTTTGRDLVKIECDIHPWMRAYVIVSRHAYVAVTGEGGAFRIDGLPVGRHTLEAWHEVLGTRTLTVDVRAEGADPVEISFAAR